jgi:hypothetical protein
VAGMDALWRPTLSAMRGRPDAGLRLVLLGCLHHHMPVEQLGGIVEAGHSVTMCDVLTVVRW